jgi:hypothetical protein
MWSSQAAGPARRPRDPSTPDATSLESVDFPDAVASLNGYSISTGETPVDPRYSPCRTRLRPSMFARAPSRRVLPSVGKPGRTHVKIDEPRGRDGPRRRRFAAEFVVIVIGVLVRRGGRLPAVLEQVAPGRSITRPPDPRCVQRAPGAAAPASGVGRGSIGRGIRHCHDVAMSEHGEDPWGQATGEAEYLGGEKSATLERPSGAP